MREEERKEEREKGDEGRGGSEKKNGRKKGKEGERKKYHVAFCLLFWRHIIFPLTN